MTLRDVLLQHRIVVCVGSGGVGKTTTSAALSVRAAMHGKRVVCLTIDPARRLANSLGLTEMRTAVQEVPQSLFHGQGLECSGKLFAMMLDTKGTFDELVAEHAPSIEVKNRILSNRLYQYVSSSLAGTQEYMAMEKLYAVRQDPQWELIVLDTPPTGNALNFLEAPEKLVGLVDSPALRWFMQAFESAGKRSLNVVGRGAAFLFRGLSRFTGAAFLEQVAAFVTDLNALFGGFRDRAQQVEAILRSPEVAFVVVTSPHPLAMHEAIYLHKKLSASGIAVRAIVVNNVHTVPTEPHATTAELEALAKDVLPNGIDPRRAVDKMRRAFDEAVLRGKADQRATVRLTEQVRESGPMPLPFIVVPAFDEDVHDLEGLARVSTHLVQHLS